MRCITRCLCLLVFFVMGHDALAQNVEDAKPYQNHKLVRVTVESMRDMLAYEQLGTYLECRPGVGQMHLVVPPEAMDAVRALDADAPVLVENYQERVDAMMRANNEALARRGGFFTAYQTNASINTFTDDLTQQNADILSRSVIGQSHEGRDIHALTLTAPYGPGEARRPQVVLNGCQHAREWVSPSSVLFVLDQLVANAGNDPQVDEILESVELHFIPMCNPDGYVYTFTNQRLWRKNRRPVGGGIGVDLNRNWSFQWGGAGSSGSVSSDVYRGPSPFSEPETQVVRDYILSLPDVHGHIDFHSFAQLILGPWAYSTSAAPPRADEHVLVQNEMASAMTSANGVTYIAGLGTDALLGPAAGAMQDWTPAEVDALGWTIELRPNSSFPGFELPPDEIIPTGEEALEAVKVLAEFAALTLEIAPSGSIPSQVSSQQATSVSVSITAFNTEELDPSTPELLYRLDSSDPFASAPLTESGGVYTGMLPSVACGQTIEFYFRAESTSGEVATLPDGAPSSLFTAEGAPINVVFVDDFETDQGWTVSGSVTDGEWERALPIGGGDRADPPSDFDGSGLCYLTDAEDGNSDVDDGTTILTSPVFDLSDGGTIEYAYWMDSTNFDADSLTVEIATDPAGTDWTQLRSYTTPESSWRTDAIDVTTEASPSSTVRIRFLATDGGEPSVIEAGLDAVSVVQTGECCPGDCDGNGIVDFSDLTAMLFAFGGQDPVAGCDADGSGIVDFNDLTSALFLFGPCE